MSLVQKLCKVMEAVTYVQKTGRNESQKYNYATEADVAEMIRKELVKVNVFIFPNCVRNERSKMERTKDYGKGPITTVSYATDVEIDWTFVDGDTGEKMTCRIPGCSESPGDKGVYVAMTGSEKYLLMKSFLIPTGDDSENDSNEQPGSTAGAQAVAEKKIQDYQDRTGKTREQIELETQKAMTVALPATKTQRIAPGAPQPTIQAIPEDIPNPFKDSPSPFEGVQTPIPQMPLITKVGKVTRAGCIFITYDGEEVSVWDKKLHPYLKEGVGADLELMTAKKGDKTYVNVKRAHQIGDVSFDDQHVAQIQRDLQQAGFTAPADMDEYTL